MKTKQAKMTGMHGHANRMRLTYGITAAAVVIGGLLGYGFSTSQKAGPLKTWSAVGKIAAAVWGAVMSCLGGFDDVIKALIIMMTVDYVTGLIMAACGKSKKTPSGKLSSRIGYKGIAKKIAMLIIVAMGVLFDSMFGSGHWVRNAFACFYCVNEFISILEHAKKLGVSTPPLDKILGKLLDQSGIALDKTGLNTGTDKSTEGKGIG